MPVRRLAACAVLLVVSLLIVAALMTQVHASQCGHNQIRRVHLHRCVGIYSSLAAPYLYRWPRHRHHHPQRDTPDETPDRYYVDVSIHVKPELKPEPEAPRKTPPRFSTSPWDWPVE